MSQAHKEAISRGVKAYHATCSKKAKAPAKGKAPKTTARMGGKAVKRMPKPMVGGMKPEPAKKRVNPVANPFSSAVRMKRGGGRRKQVAY